MDKNVIVLHPQDNVGTAVADLATGTIIELPGRSLKVAEAIPFGFKIALEPIDQGAAVIKYGESIGVAKIDVATGSCVHVSNVESQRGRGDLTSTRL